MLVGASQFRQRTPARFDTYGRRVLATAAILAAALHFSAVTLTVKASTDMESPIISTGPLGFPYNTQSPFLFAVHHLDYYPPGKPDMSIGASTRGRRLGMDFGRSGPGQWNMYHGKKVPGFPEHPHRGFETITVVREGTVDHSDSMGCAGRYGDGDTQWMTAGKGLSHCEMFPQIHEDKPNTLDLFQIWLNLPRRSKMVEPHFQMQWAENAVVVDFPSPDDESKKTKVRAVTGPISKEIKAPQAPPPDSWAADPDNHVAVWVITMEPGASWAIPKTEAGINRSLFFIRGSAVAIGNGASRTTLTEQASVHVVPTVDVPLYNSGDDSVEILMLQGRPIDEPVVKHGPFVMNSQEEIMQAFDDYSSGKMGTWDHHWDVSGVVHPKEAPRFAVHAGGRSEHPPTTTAEPAAVAGGAGVEL